MAKDTLLNLRNEIIYCIYVRNHTPEGTFAAIMPDLQRIRGLGVDNIWFMPDHPIAVMKRKGVEGSPYAIKDYRAVNPAYGTMNDFKTLADAIHDLGMKLKIEDIGRRVPSPCGHTGDTKSADPVQELRRNAAYLSLTAQ